MKFSTEDIFEVMAEDIERGDGPWQPHQYSDDADYRRILQDNANAKNRRYKRRQAKEKGQGRRIPGSRYSVWVAP